jgi:hypothetical protein
MSTPIPSDDPEQGSDRELSELRERWTEQYGASVAARLEPNRRYALVSDGTNEYAFTDYDRYVRALRRLWDSDLVPELLPSVLGSRLLDVAPRLRALDPDPDDLSES